MHAIPYYDWRSAPDAGNLPRAPWPATDQVEFEFNQNIKLRASPTNTLYFYVRYADHTDFIGLAPTDPRFSVSGKKLRISGFNAWKLAGALEVEALSYSPVESTETSGATAECNMRVAAAGRESLYLVSHNVSALHRGTTFTHDTFEALPSGGALTFTYNRNIVFPGGGGSAVVNYLFDDFAAPGQGVDARSISQGASTFTISGATLSATIPAVSDYYDNPALPGGPVGIAGWVGAYLSVLDTHVRDATTGEKPIKIVYQARVMAPLL